MPRLPSLLLALLLASPAPALVIEADKAAVKTEGSPATGGGWNLFSNGHVGQPVRLTAGGTYQITIRAWGSPAGGVWPEMALLVDGRAAKTVSVDSAERRDYAFQADLTPGLHEVAAAFLNDALIGREDRNLYLERITIRPPNGVAEPVVLAGKELAEAGETREREVLAGTAAAIEKHRKSDARLRVLDAQGRPVAGAKVTVEQTGHEFLFGSNIYSFDRYPNEAQNAAYKKRFEELFNYATVGFYWRWYEHERGKPLYDYTDKVVTWARDRGIRLKGHPLLWGDEAGIPVWSAGQPAPEIQRRRVEEIMDRYRGRIEFWEVVNEPSHLPQLKIDDPYRWARQADPRGQLIVNDYYVLADGGPAFFRLLSEARQRGVPFDGIGIQAHEPRTMRFPLDRVQAVLDQYATLGKGLHITEFTPASSGQRITGSHRDGVWDEAAQAEYAESFYRVLFAHPAVRAITWWDLCDRGSWLPGGGMLRDDLTPKPVYDRLRRLIHDEWQTHLTSQTDPTGHVSFRGFRGAYRITIEAPGLSLVRTFALTQSDPQELTLTPGERDVGR